MSLNLRRLRMKKALQDRLHKLVEEEQRYDVDLELLDRLRALATEESTVINLAAPVRNSLNVFFQEIRSMMFNELMAGNYGAEIIVETAIVLSFEVGYRLRETEQL